MTPFGLHYLEQNCARLITCVICTPQQSTNSRNPVLSESLKYCHTFPPEKKKYDNVMQNIVNHSFSLFLQYRKVVPIQYQKVVPNSMCGMLSVIDLIYSKKSSIIKDQSRMSARLVPASPI